MEIKTQHKIHKKQIYNLDIANCFIDGASRGNPGPSSIGIIIQDSKDRNILEIKEYIGSNKTNNIAEYCALLRLFEELKKMNIRNVIVNMDSELVLRQVTGVYRTRDTNLKQLLFQIKSLEKELGTVKYKHITRKHNKLADRLANSALNLKGY